MARHTQADSPHPPNGPLSGIASELARSEAIPEDFQLNAYDYHLPTDQIAQSPRETRDRSRLFVVPRNGSFQSRKFRDVLSMVAPGSLLVMNDTRVIPARLYARKSSGGNVELLRVHDPNLPGDHGRFMSKGARLKQPGTQLHFTEDSATLLRRETDGTLILALDGEGSFDEIQLKEGELPLPPYIVRPEGPDNGDRERYQTVYAQESGAVAAPTAGLHFTEDLLEELKAHGVDRAFITLHVGPGTFQPVRSQDVRQHEIRPEWAKIPEETREKILATRQAGNPIIAVGTTVVRTLEGAALRNNASGTHSALFQPENIVIRPGHRFRVVDGLITNFHLPRSSLMLLVAALVGRERLLTAYQNALEAGYRFYSYGDAMFIPPSNARTQAPE